MYLPSKNLYPVHMGTGRDEYSGVVCAAGKAMDAVSTQRGFFILCCFGDSLDNEWAHPHFPARILWRGGGAAARATARADGLALREMCAEPNEVPPVAGRPLPNTFLPSILLSANHLKHLTAREWHLLSAEDCQAAEVLQTGLPAPAPP